MVPPPKPLTLDRETVAEAMANEPRDASMLALVGAGLGMALVPEAADVIRMANVVLRPIRLPANVVAELSLAWRRSDAGAASLAARNAVLALFRK